MLYSIAADLVLIVHALFIAFVVSGALLAFWRRYWLWLHVPALLWGIAIEWLGVLCPLTPLENRLRHLAGQSGYSGGFIDHYLWPLVYPDGLTRTHQIWLGTALVVVNALLYLLLYRRRRRAG